MRKHFELRAFGVTLHRAAGARQVGVSDDRAAWHVRRSADEIQSLRLQASGGSAWPGG